MYRHIDQSRGAHAKAAEVVGAQGGLTQSGGVAEGAEGVVWRAQGGAALAHGTEASSLRCARHMVTFSGAGSCR